MLCTLLQRTNEDKKIIDVVRVCVEEAKYVIVWFHVHISGTETCLELDSHTVRYQKYSLSFHFLKAAAMWLSVPGNDHIASIKTLCSYCVYSAGAQSYINVNV